MLREVWKFFGYLWRDFEGKRFSVRESWMLATIIRGK